MVSIWQNSDQGQVPGIAGNVDLNVFNGTLDRLPLLGKPAPSEPEEPSNEYAYLFGFADLAARLGANVVGDPLENEHASARHGHPISHQLTTRGEMVYWAEHNRAEFYPAA
jgi:hypothetical protein